MSKHLFVVRHTQAYEASTNQADFDRELTPLGISEANAAGNFISSFHLTFEAIICSSARRTKSTALILAEAVRFDLTRVKAERALYNSTAKTLLKTITMLENTVDAIIIVGHNPSVSEVVSRLRGTEQIYVPTGGCNYFAFDAPDWQSVEWADSRYQANF